MSAQFLIGCDPELFVKKNNQPITAHGLVPGDKENPHKVEEGAIQVDGMALEFNINPVPMNDFETFNGRITKVLSQMKKALPEGVSYLKGPSVQFDTDYYENHVPEDAKELGCDPDFCAYSEELFEPNPRPDGDSGLRSAAGHIHVGWGSDIPVDSEEHARICRDFVKNMDCYVGLAMLVIDDDERRRTLYGKAGAYRLKSYGVEYRTPSNAWIWTKDARRFIHQQVVNCITNMLRSGGHPAHRMLAGKGIDVQSIINSGDQEQALFILQSLMYCTVPNHLIVGKTKVQSPAEEALKAYKNSKKAA